jgi:glutamate-1-semialdehyde 2,1-aminomutase
MKTGGTTDALRDRLQARYRERRPQSHKMHAMAMKVLPGGDTRTGTYFPPYPLYVEEAAGTHLKDVDGHSYLDFLNNFTSLIHGHSHPAITEAVTRQLAQGTVYGAPCESQFRLANMLCERISSLELVRFCNSGTEATLGAIRAARAFTGREKILKMEGGYHGTHDWALVSATPAYSPKPPRRFPSLADGKGVPRAILRGVVVAPFNDAETTRHIIQRHGESLAAILVEPVMSSAGCIPAQPEYLRTLRELADYHGIILIYDEIVSFRIAQGGAQEVLGVRPDLTALAKVIGGGFPVGAFGGRSDIMGMYAPDRRLLPHSGTYNGNPITMVAGVKALELLTHDAYSLLNALGDRIRDRARETLKSAGIAGQVTGIGSLLHLHFTDRPVTDYRTAATGDKELNAFLHLSLLEHGIFMARRGMACLSTPMTDAEPERFVAALRMALEEIRPAIKERRPELLVG